MDGNISEKQLRNIFEQSIISFVFDGYHKRNTPTTVFLGAQPAAGKTAGQRHILDMYPDHSIVPIVGDDFRHFHPDCMPIRMDIRQSSKERGEMSEPFSMRQLAQKSLAENAML